MIEQVKRLYEEIRSIISEIQTIDYLIKNQTLIGLYFKQNSSIYKKVQDLVEALESAKQKLESERQKLQHEFTLYVKLHYLVESIFDEDRVDFKYGYMDPKESKYESSLNDIWRRLTTTGITDEHEFDTFKQYYKELELLIEEFPNFKKFIMQTPGISNALRDDFLEKKLDDFDILEEQYEYLFESINQDTNHILNKEEMRYLLRNTNIMPLVYANNKEQIRGKSSNQRTFCCQFHCEKTPSMRVSLIKSYFVCYGCGIKGNAVEYLMKYHNIDKSQAIYLLAEIFLIDIPDNPYKQPEYFELVNKYRQAITSEEYKTFLLDIYNHTEKKAKNESLFGNIFEQIERIKSGTYDPNFIYTEEDKKFYLSKKLVHDKEEFRGNCLPF